MLHKQPGEKLVAVWISDETENAKKNEKKEMIFKGTEVKDKLTTQVMSILIYVQYSVPLK